jgi:hypothetical protein
MQWIHEISDEAAFRATRVLTRALAMPQVLAAWRQQPTFLGLLLDAEPRPNVLIGGPEAIAKEIAKHLPPARVSRIESDLAALWADPRREEAPLALVVWSDPDESHVAVQIERSALGIVSDPPVKPGPLPEGASLEERRRWLRRHGAIAVDRVGGANMRACAARDEVAIVAVEADGELSYGYVPRARYAADFPEPVQLRPGESAACHAILVDMSWPGDNALYEPFRMVAWPSGGTKGGVH